MRHPLEPRTLDEIRDVVRILRRDENLGSGVRFVSITLQEPPKSTVLAFPARARGRT
ncbi:MAG: hypothetical protein JO020_33595 [Chloroflexi bacterium]|nr:hypothetical protein [Chloroflexota bacterium]MBV9899117.1 hypothetical protein [Chloroflexota bacterium]